MKKNNNETTRTSPGKTAHQKQVWADLGLLLTAMIWGTGFVFSKQAVTEMDGVTQQNAALVQQSAAAAASLEEQAQQLSRSISSFRLPVQA